MEKGKVLKIRNHNKTKEYNRVPHSFGSWPP
uniref:Uncharacterized protein n=1 Tax=Anguilla anguilla TaxID=7936 RepID=A0A0E9VSZ0_ANGAN